MTLRGAVVVDDIKRASEAKNVNELITWIKKGSSNSEKKQRLEEAKKIDFYWASFNSDLQLKEVESIL
jgi:hypothetical protein